MRAVGRRAGPVAGVLVLWGASALAGDSLPPLGTEGVPRTVEELWAGYDPRAEPLEVETVREWSEASGSFRHVLYTVGTFRGRVARMAAFYGAPAGASDGDPVPGLLHLHGGGQRASLSIVREYVGRGYAILSINWGGREMEAARPGDGNTDWGAVDPTQRNVPGYASLLPSAVSLDARESPRNNNWFLLTIGARRGITLLERCEEVDAGRIGVFGHSMGGRLTCLVAGVDRRVRVAAPSVGGSGFLQSDLWGLPGSARRVTGDLELFGATLAGEAYLPRVTCPILFLGATNDFNAPLDHVERGMALVPHERKRVVYAPHFNHRFTPETEMSRRLWLAAHLRGDARLPGSPTATLELDREDGVPVYVVAPDLSREVVRVEIRYGYDRDPRNRFWASARAQRRGAAWEGSCPVFDTEEPLHVFASVAYRLAEDERRAGDPDLFEWSVSDAVHPARLREAGVRATAERSRLVDDFARGLEDWYVLEGGNPRHWLFATRKLVDPRWVGPRGAVLELELETSGAGDELAVEIETDAWRSYLGRRRRIYTAIVPLKEAGRSRVELAASDLVDEAGERLEGWDRVTQLLLRPGERAQQEAGRQPWRGGVPRLVRVAWKGGRPGPWQKPYPQDPGGQRR